MELKDRRDRETMEVGWCKWWPRPSPLLSSLRSLLSPIARYRTLQRALAGAIALLTLLPNQRIRVRWSKTQTRWDIQTEPTWESLLHIHHQIQRHYTCSTLPSGPLSRDSYLLFTSQEHRIKSSIKISKPFLAPILTQFIIIHCLDQHRNREDLLRTTWWNQFWSPSSAAYCQEFWQSSSHMRPGWRYTEVTTFMRRAHRGRRGRWCCSACSLVSLCPLGG